MVIELAAGDLNEMYLGKGQAPYSLKVGLKILLGAAKGLAHMHSMPLPVVHRDIKSGNIMVMADGVTGKLGDCGQSRRTDLNATMTKTGSPLWAAPELLGGKRYAEDVDTYSFGIVLYEIACRDWPYRSERKAFRDSGGKGFDWKLMNKISAGKCRARLNGDAGRACAEYGIGRLFKKLFRHCTKFKPKERPAIGDVVQRLEAICKAADKGEQRGGALRAKPKIVAEESTPNPWTEGSTIATALQSFASRIQELKKRQKLQDLRRRVGTVLGTTAVDPISGIYNDARLYRFLCINEMQVQDAKSMVVENASARS